MSVFKGRLQTAITLQGKALPRFRLNPPSRPAAMVRLFTGNPPEGGGFLQKQIDIRLAVRGAFSLKADGRFPISRTRNFYGDAAQIVVGRVAWNADTRQTLGLFHQSRSDLRQCISNRFRLKTDARTLIAARISRIPDLHLDIRHFARLEAAVRLGITQTRSWHLDVLCRMGWSQTLAIDTHAIVYHLLIQDDHLMATGQSQPQVTNNQ